MENIPQEDYPDLNSDEFNEESIWRTLLNKDNSTINNSNAENNTSIDDVTKDRLQRFGFNKAIEARCQSEELFAELIGSHEVRFTELVKNWEEIYARIQYRLKEKIEQAENEIKTLEHENSKDDTALLELLGLKDSILKTMLEIKNKLYGVRMDLANEKKDAARKWIEDAQIEIGRAIQLEHKIYEETKIINVKKYEDSKPALTAELEYIKEIRQQYKERYEAVLISLKLIGADGINPFITYLLIGIGTTTAGIAGYFFSVYTYTSSFSSQDVFYFLINGFLKSSRTDTGSDFLWKFLYLLGILVLLTIVSLLCYRYLKIYFPKEDKKNQVREKYKIKANFQYQGIGYLTEIKSSSWFSLWLRLLPFLLIGGIVVLLLATNKLVNEDINALNASTEGLVIGTGLAMGLAGLFYLYIIKIIEPRLLKIRKEDSTSFYQIKHNWELVVAVILFIVSTILIIFYRIEKGTVNGVLPNQSIAYISIFEFLSTCFLSAFSFAYGIRLRGLIATASFLERQVLKLDNMIVDVMSVEQDAGYTDKAQSLLDDYMLILNNKLYFLTGAVVKRDGCSIDVLKKQEQEKKQSAFAKAIEWIGINKPNVEQKATSIFKVLEWEEICFPEICERIKELNSEYQEQETELNRINQKIEELHTQNENEAYLRDQLRKKLNTNINRYWGIFFKSEVDKISRIQRINAIRLDELNALKEGFHLGEWYRENKIGPTDDYFVLRKPQKLIGYGN